MKLGTDLAIRKTLGDEVQNAAFELGQGMEFRILMHLGIANAIQKFLGHRWVDKRLTRSHSADSRREIVALYLFEHESRRPGQNRLEHRLVVGERGQHEARNFGKLRPDITTDLDPASVGQLYVEDRNVGRRGRDPRERVGTHPGLAHHHDSTRRLQNVADPLANDFMVIEQKHAYRLGGVFRWHPPSTARQRQRSKGPSSLPKNRHRQSHEVRDFRPDMRGPGTLCARRWARQDPLMTNKPIVVGVDGSPASSAALRWALDEGILRDCDVKAVHCWHLFPARSGQYSMGASELAMFEESAVSLLDNELREAGAFDNPRVHKVIRYGDATALLLEESAKAEMLVVGARGAGGFTGLLVGSVTSKLTKHASCPIVVVPGKRS